jgi:hypothetical protein
MSRTTRALFAALVSAVLLAPMGAVAQDQGHTAIVSIYHIAPGRQLDFLKWMASREAVDRDVGVPPAQWYVHLDGDSWDYVAVSPDADAARSEKVDAAAAKRGLKTGMASGLELRTMLASHTDTYSAGPYTAAEVIERMQQH